MSKDEWRDMSIGGGVLFVAGWLIGLFMFYFAHSAAPEPRVINQEAMQRIACGELLKAAGLLGKPESYENIGRLYGTALALRSVPKRVVSPGALDAAGSDVKACFYP